MTSQDYLELAHRGLKRALNPINQAWLVDLELCICDFRKYLKLINYHA